MIIVIRISSTLRIPAFLMILCISFILNSGFYSNASAQESEERPNVLMISIDDLNDWIGVLNTHPQVKTPNIDRLAARGTLFTNAHAQAPLCNPSRVSLMTGLRPSTTGIYGLAPAHYESETTKDVETLPEYFEAYGYQTFSTGKVFHNTSSNEAAFQTDGTPGQFFGPVPDKKIVQKSLDMVNHPLVDWGVFPEEGDSVIQDYKVTTWAEEKLEEFESQKNDKPFFMAVGFWLPHVPLYTTQKWFDLYPDDESLVLPPAPEEERIDIPDFAWYLHWYLPEPRLSWLIENNEWESKVRAYLATISFIDSQVGRVLDKLEAEKLDKNTIVVLWSDHGYHLGEKGITGKNSLWERSTRVPLIFAGPDISVDAQSSQPVELLDIYPTLTELVGLTANEKLEGLSLLPQLQNADTPRKRPAITTHNPGNHSVRSERWRYIRYADGSEELYDHFRDPNEWNNLAGNPEYSDVIEEHSRWLPQDNAPHAPGSRHRILLKKDGEWFWEGERIIFENLVH